MQLQVALCQSLLKLAPEGFCFAFAAAVDQSIIGVPTPGKVGMRPRYPEIERVMHEQVRQNRTDHTTLRRAAASLDYRSIFLHHRRCQPSFDVEQRPLARHVFPDSPQQERVVDIVELASSFSAYWSHVTSSMPGAARFFKLKKAHRRQSAGMMQKRREAFLPVPGNGLAYAALRL